MFRLIPHIKRYCSFSAIIFSVVLINFLSACVELPQYKNTSGLERGPKSVDANISLEDAVNPDELESLVAMARQKAAATVSMTTLEEIDLDLRPHDRIYKPVGAGPFPAVLFFHGCSGPTISHEEDWAQFYNDEGIVMIAVNSYSGRDINWVDACDVKVMTPWQRVADVLSTVRYTSSIDYVDASELYLTGFSHGAYTIWQTLTDASVALPPLSLKDYPKTGIDGVKAAFLFYGSCVDDWTVDVDVTLFLGDADRYVKTADCEAYKHPKAAGRFELKIYNGSTHTFDHSNPNQANIDAGSFYDEAATKDSQRMIKSAIIRVDNPVNR
jgi:dienelactone hydrolase